MLYNIYLKHVLILRYKRYNMNDYLIKCGVESTTDITSTGQIIKKR